MPDLIRGNLTDRIGQNKRGWAIGFFADPQHPFHEHGFEMQWIELGEGVTKSGGPGRNKAAKTMCILISGHLRLFFSDPDETVDLQKPGDYVYFPPGTSHFWEVVRQTVTMTLRWPSILDDQELSGTEAHSE
jgi:hypothetical protein